MAAGLMNHLLLFEDDHLLVVNKPSGINTHKPDADAPDGLHEWLTKREPRWAKLSILQRLDKDTSGVMVVAKTEAARRAIKRAFAAVKDNLLGTIFCTLVLGIVGSLGAILCGVGVFFTLPIAFIGSYHMAKQITGGDVRAITNA